MRKCSNGERFHGSRSFDLTKKNSAKTPNLQILIYKLKNPLKHLSFSSSLLLVYYFIRHMCIIAMHWLHRPSRRAKVEQRVSSWSGGQTCYQVALGIALKLVPYSIPTHHVFMFSRVTHGESRPFMRSFNHDLRHPPMH